MMLGGRQTEMYFVSAEEQFMRMPWLALGGELATKSTERGI